MPRTVLKLLVAGSVLIFLGASQEDQSSNEKKAFCLVYVTGSDSDDESLEKVVNEVAKKIKEMKKWFRLTEDRLEADIRVEVTQYGRVEQLKSHTRRQEGVQGGGTGTQGGSTISRPALLDVESSFFIEFGLVVPRQFQTKMMTRGRGRGSTAKEVARRLRPICDTYCK